MLWRKDFTVRFQDSPLMSSHRIRMSQSCWWPPEKQILVSTLVKTKDAADWKISEVLNYTLLSVKWVRYRYFLAFFSEITMFGYMHNGSVWKRGKWIKQFIPFVISICETQSLMRCPPKVLLFIKTCTLHLSEFNYRGDSEMRTFKSI